jgi:GT2 family glycosyltransferase
MELLSEFQDKRLRRVAPPRHCGMSDNFAFCADQSMGEYLNFLPSDDFLLPGFCSRLVKILDEHVNIVFAHCACKLVDGNSRDVGFERSIHPSFIRSGVDELQRYVWGQRSVFTGTLIRRTAYEQVGGMAVVRDMVGDWDLCLRLLRLGDVAYCSEVLAGYRWWSTPIRRKRFVAQVRDTRLLYDRLYKDGTAALLRGGTTTLGKARQSWARNFATGLPYAELSQKEWAELADEIKLVDDSFGVRARLFMMRGGFGPMFAARRKVQGWLRQRVKSVLYPLTVKNPA